MELRLRRLGCAGSLFRERLVEAETGRTRRRNRQLTACELEDFCVEGVEEGSVSGNEVSRGFPQTFDRRKK